MVQVWLPRVRLRVRPVMEPLAIAVIALSGAGILSARGRSYKEQAASYARLERHYRQSLGAYRARVESVQARILGGAATLGGLSLSHPRRLGG